MEVHESEVPPDPFLPWVQLVCYSGLENSGGRLLTGLLLYHQEHFRVWIKNETQSYTVQGPKPVCFPRGSGAWPAGTWRVLVYQPGSLLCLLHFEFLWRFHPMGVTH